MLAKIFALTFLGKVHFPPNFIRNLSTFIPKVDGNDNLEKKSKSLNSRLAQMFSTPTKLSLLSKSTTSGLFELTWEDSHFSATTLGSTLTPSNSMEIRRTVSQRRKKRLTVNAESSRRLEVPTITSAFLLFPVNSRGLSPFTVTSTPTNLTTNAPAQ